jgi:hypothetical protein
MCAVRGVDPDKAAVTTSPRNLPSFLRGNQGKKPKGKKCIATVRNRKAGRHLTTQKDFDMV